jgi:hypothetical protein
MTPRDVRLPKPWGLATMTEQSTVAVMSGEERVQVIHWLSASREAFLGAIARVSATQWRWKPSPDRWCIGETAEHVVLAEALMFGAVQGAVADRPNPDWLAQTAGKTDLLVRVMPSSRHGKARAPDPTWPRQQLTRAQVVERFLDERERINRFAAETEHPVKAHTRVHPFPVFGTLNAYQWLVYIPLHTLRHAEQIAAVHALSDCPVDGA